jgi:predicted MFS family arabinose efflux permease
MRWLKRFCDGLTAAHLRQFTLFSLPLIDELVSTIPVLAIPLLRSEWDISYSQAGWLLGIGGLSAWLVEPVVNAASDQWPQRRILFLALLGMIVALALAGASSNFTILVFAFLLMGACNGPLLGMGQAFLIDSNLAESLRTMTRWTVMGALGDLAGPALIAAALAWGLGWRGLFWAGALIWLLALFALLLQRLPASVRAGQDSSGEEEAEPFSWRYIAENLALALRTPHLVRWLALGLLPSFLDEMFLAFAALFLQDRLGMTSAAISMALMVHIAGGLIGLAWLDRFGRHFQPARLLGWLALVVLAGLLLFVLTSSPWLAVFALWIVGLGASGWYPIASAEAYRALPGRSGMVRALSSLLAPVEVVAPFLIGLAAQQWGIQIGVALIMLAPLAVFLLRPRKDRLPNDIPLTC